MNINNSEEEYISPRSFGGVDSPRKRMRLDNSARKSWSLMDRRTDHEVLQEMGVSLLEQDDGEAANEVVLHHRPPLKRKHNIENVSPNVLSVSPRKLSGRKTSPSAGPSKRSPRSTDKSKPLTDSQLSDTTLVSEYVIDEETPLGQCVGAHYLPPATAPAPAAKRPGSFTPLGQEEEEILTKRAKWEPVGDDSFRALSDEVMLSVFRWLPKRTLAHCMMVCKRWYRVACDETLWQRLDLGNKTLSRDALGRILARKPVIIRLASSEIAEWRPTSPPEPTRIQYLDLSMAAVDSASLNSLLRRCPLLKKLSLENLHLADTTCELIGQCSNLETLNLAMGQGITPEGLTSILQGCTSLQSLNISWCNLSEDSLQVLVTSLPSRLQRLNLGGARLITDEMIEALVVRCPRLLELDLSDCSRLSNGTVSAVFGLTRLEHLALSRCYLLPAATLAKLHGMVSLQYLEVWGMLQSQSVAALRVALPAVQINQFMFSAIARPTVGTRRTSIWGLRTRD